jgi:hypothetical protein
MRAAWPLQCIATKSTKVGNEQPPKQPPEKAKKVVQNSRKHSGSKIRSQAWWLFCEVKTHLPLRSGF